MSFSPLPVPTWRTSIRRFSRDSVPGEPALCESGCPFIWTRPGDNPFLSDTLRNISGQLGFYNGQMIPLTAIEPAVNDLDGTGLGQALTTFHGALQETTANPASEVQRMALLESAEFLAQSFRSTSEQLVDSAEKTRDQAGRLPSTSPILQKRWRG